MVAPLKLYDRGVRLQITPPIPGSRADATIPGPILVNPIPPPGGGLPSVPQLRVVFSVTKSVSPEAQQGSVTVFGLAKTTRAIVSGNAKRAIDLEPPSKIGLPPDLRFLEGPPLLTAIASGVPYLRLEAGYGAVLSVIFEGTNVKVRNRRRGVDWATQFAISDGELQLNQTTVHKSFVPGTTAFVAVQYVAGAMGLTVVPTAGSATLSSYILSGGFAANGRASEALVELFPLIPKLSYFVDAGLLWILAPGEVVPGPPVIVASEGVPGSVQLLEAPEPIDEYGVQIRALLAPQIRHGALIQLASREVVGGFRVESVTHAGDNRGGGFQTQATLRSIAAV